MGIAMSLAFPVTLLFSTLPAAYPGYSRAPPSPRERLLVVRNCYRDLERCLTYWSYLLSRASSDGL